MRIAIGVEYNGAAFCGWQTQPGGCGVQDALELALSGVAGTRVETTCAGRTDTGVHAIGQVAHFDCSTERPLTAWTRGANALLPDGVAVTWAQPVGDGFHARFSAKTRRYVYWLLSRPQRPGLLAGRVGWTHRKLDEAAMAQSAQCLLGEHDFSAFRAAECQAKTPVKTMRELRVTRRGDLLRFEFAADAFLQHMVRNIVGSLVYVGSGRHPVQWMQTLLEGRDRTVAAPTFSPAGLYLADVEYDETWALPRAPDARRIEDLLAATS